MKYSCLLPLLLILITSCGFLNDKAPEGADSINQSSLQTTSCKIDTEKLSKIAQEDVSEQIDCLALNLQSFSKLVKVDNQNIIKEEDLGKFISTFFKEKSVDILNGLNLIFKINTIFLNDQDHQISKKNLKTLFELLKSSNQVAFKVNNLIQNAPKKEAEILAGAEVLQSILASFSKRSKDLIQAHLNGAEKTLNLNELLPTIQRRMGVNNLDQKTFSSFLSFKKLFLGGNSDTLTASELLRLLDIMPTIAKSAYITLFSTRNLTNPFKIYLEQFEKIENNFFPHSLETKIFDLSGTSTMFHFLFKDDSQFISRILKGVKESLIDGLEPRSPAESLVFEDIKILSSYLKAGLSSFHFWQQNEKRIEKVKSNQKENKEEIKKLFITDAQDLAQELRRHLSTVPTKIKIKDFLVFITNEFESLKTVKENIDLILKGKKILLGGNKNSTNMIEINTLLNNTTELAAIFFEMNSFDKKAPLLKQALTVHHMILNMLKILSKENPHRIAISDENFLTLLKGLSKNKVPFPNFISTFKKLKNPLLNGEGNDVSIKTIRNLLDFLDSAVKRFYFMDYNYDLYSDILMSEDAIEELPSRTQNLQHILTGKEINRLNQDFLMIVKKHRRFRDDQNDLSYDFGIKRSKKGFIEVSIIKFFLTTIAKKFGHLHTSKKEYSFSLKEIEALLELFKPVLMEYGLWSRQPKEFGRNALLLSDLFQSRSNGDLNMGIDEGAEYGILALSSMHIGDKVFKKIKERCEVFKEAGLLAVKKKCYRPHFLEILMEDLNYKEKLPRLYKYISENTQEDVDLYHHSVEFFSKEIKDPKALMTKKDIMLLVGALLNIESSFLRYDTNKNNYLDPKEVDHAYTVYESAIMTLAKLDKSKKHFGISIFKYMIKNQKIPSEMAIANFHYNPFVSKKVGAKRLNIGVLLYFIVAEEAKESKRKNK